MVEENYDPKPDGTAFLGDDQVPKSHIRKVFKDILDNPDVDIEMRLRAGDLLSKLEGYVGPNQGKLDELKIGVNIIQASSLKIPMPELPKLKDARREVQS